MNKNKKMVVKDNNNNKKHSKYYKSISPIILILIIIILITSLLQAKASTFMYASCSPSKYDPNSPYQANLNTLLSSIISSSSQSSYNSFVTGSGENTTTCFGLYQCRNDLNFGDCSACIQSSMNQVNLVCPRAMAASLQLEGCFLSYSHEDFRGKLDTSLVYKKCSASRSNDGEFFKRRDDVIADLEVAGGIRVSRSGTVQGYSQCLGDLTPGDCRQCVTVAVEELKDACGSAMAADVFLAKCYARYWASGYYIPSASSGYSDDDIGRTVAIIVGILAALAIIVVFISFLRKTC